MSKRQSKSGTGSKARAKSKARAGAQARLRKHVGRALQAASMRKQRDGANYVSQGGKVARRKGSVVELTDLELNVTSRLDCGNTVAARGVLEEYRRKLPGFDGDIADLAREVALAICQEQGETMEDGTGGKTAAGLRRELNEAAGIGAEE